MTTPILILAGGSSSRMGAGRHKLLEEVDGVPLLRRQAERALTASADVTVLVRPDRPDLLAALDGLDVDILIAPEAVEGMGGSLRAGTTALDAAPCFLLLLGDLVEIEAEDMRRVMSAREERPEARIWRGMTDDGKPGHPILFDRDVYPDLKRLTGDSGGSEVIAAHKARVHLVPLPGQRARRDLDTPEDWAAWRAGQ